MSVVVVISQHLLNVFVQLANKRGLKKNYVGGWVDPRASLDDIAKRKFLTLPRLELRPFGQPAHRLAIPTALPRPTLQVFIVPNEGANLCTAK
jgi:hypothetical protein